MVIGDKWAIGNLKSTIERRGSGSAKMQIIKSLENKGILNFFKNKSS